MSPRVRLVLEVVLSIAVVAAPLVTGLNFLAHAGVRDHLDVLSAILVSPTSLILPVVAVLVSCLPLYGELGDRFIANTRGRIAIRERLVGMYARASAVSFLVFFLYAFIPFLIAFVLWPLIGDPGIDPAGYKLTPAQAHADALGRNSYSFLLAGGDLPYGLVYSIWVGLAAVAFASLGFAFLLTVPNRILALSLPFVIYVAGTMGTALAGVPNVGFLYSIFPAGLQAVPPLEAAASMVILGLVAAVLVTITIHRSPTNPRLS
jgi:hypothetical protein